MIISALRAQGRAQLHLHPRRDDARVRRSSRRAVDEAYARGYLGKNILGTRGFEVSTSPCTAAPARTSAARRRRCSTRSRASAAGRASSRRSRRSRACSATRRSSTTSRPLMNVPFIVDKGGAWFDELGTGRSGGTRIALRLGPRQQARRVRAADGHHVQPDHQRGLRRRVEGPQGQGGHPRRRRRCRRSTPTSSTCRCEFDALQTDERIKPVDGPPRAAVRHRRRPPAAHDGRLGRRRRHGRARPTSRRPSWRASCVLRPRVVRPVHAVPRGHRLAREGLHAASPRATASPATSSCCASIAHGIAGNTICPLGDAAAWPMLGFLTKFRADFEARDRKTGARMTPRMTLVDAAADSAPHRRSRCRSRRRDRSLAPAADATVARRRPASAARRRVECRRACALVLVFASCTVGGALFDDHAPQPDRRRHVAGRHASSAWRRST